MIGAIDSYESFRRALRKAGFSMSGGKDEGVFSLSSAYAANIVAHTGDPDTDPWQWRIRVVTDCGDIAYGKFFLGKGGWITRPFIPLFISARRGGRTLDECYRDGLVSRRAREVYAIIRDEPDVALHEIRARLGGEPSSRLESALTALQAGLYITISGEKYKISRQGRPYGWPVNTYRTMEDAFGQAVESEAQDLDGEEAVRRIADRIRILNPDAGPRDIDRFLRPGICV